MKKIAVIARNKTKTSISSAVNNNISVLHCGGWLGCGWERVFGGWEIAQNTPIFPSNSITVNHFQLTKTTKIVHKKCHITVIMLNRTPHTRTIGKTTPTPMFVENLGFPGERVGDMNGRVIPPATYTENTVIHSPHPRYSPTSPILGTSLTQSNSILPFSQHFSSQEHLPSPYVQK